MENDLPEVDEEGSSLGLLTYEITAIPPFTWSFSTFLHISAICFVFACVCFCLKEER